MLVRIWRVRIAEERRAELERFAAEISAPMFQEFSGCLGHLFAVARDAWVTETYWESEKSLNTALASGAYAGVVSQLEATGILLGESEVEVYEVVGGRLPTL